MKKILIAYMVLITVTASAQDFRMGAKGMFYSTWLFNNNITDKEDIIDYRATFGINYGLQFLLYFNDNIGVSADLIYANNRQRVEGFNENPALTWSAEENLTYLDVPVLFYVSSEGGPYLELGPQIGFLLGAEEVLSWNNSNHPLPVETTVDYKDDFNSLSLAAILGFGYGIEISDSWSINIGLRFGYGLNDVTKKIDESEIDNPNDLSDTAFNSGQGFYNFNHSKLSQHAHWNSDNKYSYQKTSRAFGGFTLGIIYKIN